MTLGSQFAWVLSRAQAGDEQAFTSLYRDLNPVLLRYFAGQAPRAADDLASETWVAAARGIPSFTGDEDGFRAWMFTIARRRLIEHWRAGARRPETSEAPESLEDVAATDDPEGSGVEGVTAAEAAARIRAALSPDQAEVVLLRCLAGLDVDQVAEVLGKKPGTVRVLQHRALRRLAQTYSYELVPE